MGNHDNCKGKCSGQTNTQTNSYFINIEASQKSFTPDWKTASSHALADFLFDKDVAD